MTINLSASPYSAAEDRARGDLGRASTSRTQYGAHHEILWKGNEARCAAEWNLAQNRLPRQSKSWGVLFPLPYIYIPGGDSWERAFPGYQPALRREILHTTGFRSWKHRDIQMCQMLKAYGILKVTDSHVCMSLEDGTEYSSRTWSLWRKSSDA